MQVVHGAWAMVNKAEFDGFVRFRLLHDVLVNRETRRGWRVRFLNYMSQTGGCGTWLYLASTGPH